MNGRYRFSWRHLLPAAAMALFLTACGGGGGGGADISPDPFTFEPNVINAEPGGLYVVSAHVGGFEGELVASVSEVSDDIEALFENTDGTLVPTVQVTDGGILTLHITVASEAAFHSSSSVTVALGSEKAKQSSSVQINVMDTQPPSLSIDFPPARSVVVDSGLTVTGRVVDNDTVERITQLTDGSDAIAGLNGQWQKTVDLMPGLNTISLEAYDLSGNRSNVSTVDIFRRAAFFNAPRGLVSHGGELFVLNRGDDVGYIQRVDLETLQNRIVSSGSVGSGPNWTQASVPLTANTDVTTLYLADVSDPDNNRVISVDIATGDRTVIAENFTEVSGLSGGPDGKLLLLGESSDSPSQALISLDQMGNEAVVSRPGANPVGGGHHWIDPIDLVYDSVRNKMYVLTRDFNANGIYIVDLSSGDRSPLSVNGDGLGPDFSSPQAIDVDLATGDLYVVNFSGDRALIRVPTVGEAAGQRFVVSDNSDGLVLSRPMDVSIHRESSSLFIYISDLDNSENIIRVNPSDGEKDVAIRIPSGEGDVLQQANAMAVDGQRNRLLLSDSNNLTVRSVDLTSGNRSESLLIAENAINDIAIGDELAWITTRGAVHSLWNIAVDTINDDAAGVLTRIITDTRPRNTSSLLVEEGRAYIDVEFPSLPRRLIDVNTSTGEFSEAWIRQGTGLFTTELARFDESQLIGADSDGLFIGNLKSGIMQRFLTGAISSAPSMAYDSTRKLLFVFDSSKDQLLAADITSIDQPAAEILIGEGGRFSTSPGYPLDLTGQITEIRYDEVRQVLYLLSDGGREVTVLNSADILFDANEDGKIDEGDVSEGLPATRVAAEAVLLSR